MPLEESFGKGSLTIKHLCPIYTNYSRSLRQRGLLDGYWYLGQRVYKSLVREHTHSELFSSAKEKVESQVRMEPRGLRVTLGHMTKSITQICQRRCPPPVTQNNSSTNPEGRSSHFGIGIAKQRLSSIENKGLAKS